MLMGLLSNDGIDVELKNLNMQWGVIAGSELVRVFEFKNFKQALAFTNKVGDLAEVENHHPRIELEWGKVVVSITTHSEGGLTDKDFSLASKIDKIK
jgi:4a-hydroxytetrahydrobiopterin dehydratase